MDSPHISRSGRVLKKTAKVIEMEDFDLNELDLHGKPKKKGRSSEDEVDEKRISPIKIPKISFNISPAPKRFLPKMSIKPKPEDTLMRDSSPDASKESDSVSSETSSSTSTSEDSEDGEQQRFSMEARNGGQSAHSKAIVESYKQFQSTMTFADGSNQMDMSDEESSESALVIAEESSDSLKHRAKNFGAAAKKRPIKKNLAIQLKNRGGQKKRPVARNALVAKKEKPAGKTKPLSAYLLWCRENRKRIADSGAIGFGNIGKKLGEAWQALPDKEKMAWKSKAKRLALKANSGLISTGPVSEVIPKTVSCSPSDSTEDTMQIVEGASPLGISVLDSASHLSLLGQSLSTIGERLTEHEGQLAVHGIFSVLLDTILCVVGPLLCLTTESPSLNAIPEETLRNTLDSIAYFMPGL